VGTCAANADEFFHGVCKLVPNKKRSLAGFGRKGDFPTN
jgi:hypothetical protein